MPAYRTFLLAAACGLVFTAAPASANDPAKRADPTAELLAKLKMPAKFDFRDEVKLLKLCEAIEKKYGVPVLLNEEELKARGVGNLDELTVKLPRTNDLSLAAFLKHTLGQLQATFLIRKEHLEVTPISVAARDTKNEFEDRGGAILLREPLVSAIFKEKPFNEAVEELAEDFNLTVTVAQQAGNAKTKLLTARLLNVPADKAIELMALQCDLRVVRRGTAYMLTSKDHANELFNEKLDKERQKLEVEKMRPKPMPLPGTAPGMPSGFSGQIPPGLYHFPNGLNGFWGTFPKPDK